MGPTRGNAVVAIALATLAMSMAFMNYIENWPHGPSALVEFLIDLNPEPTGEPAFVPARLIRLSESRGLLVWSVGTGFSAVTCFAYALVRPEAFLPDQRRAFVIIFGSLALFCLGARLIPLIHILRVVY